MIRYSSGSRGQSAKLLIAGWRQKLQPIKCNCPVGSCSRRLDGAKPLFSHKRKYKSNPARISIWSLRLVGQDASLSSWKYGFESRRDHQSVRHIGIGLILAQHFFLPGLFFALGATHISCSAYMRSHSNGSICRYISVSAFFTCIISCHLFHPQCIEATR